MTSPRVTIPEYLEHAKRQGVTEEAAVSVIVGDLQRMELYAKLGYQLPQQIPAPVKQAFHTLVELGYDSQLVKE